MKKKIKRKERNHSSLPPHTWEAHPKINSGETNKTFLIVLISIALVIVLILFLFIGSKFVGKAIYSTREGNGVDITSTPEGKVLITATLANKVDAAGVYLELQSATSGFDLCTALGNTNSITSSLWGRNGGFYDVSCSGGILRIADATLGDDLRSGTFTVAEFPLAGAPQSLNVMLTTIDIYNSVGIDLFPRGNIPFTIIFPACSNGATRSCGGPGVGVCTAGTQNCQNGVWSQCSGIVTASAEICDQKDNNCNGQTDENNICSQPNLCGNGVIDNGEACDDRNTANNDGCSSTCQIETLYECSGVPSVCQRQLTVTSNTFSNGELIPDAYTCKGRNVNPPLTVSNIPTGTQSLLVMMEDPDVDNNPTVNPEIPFVHWVVLNIPVPAATTTITIPEAATFTSSSIISINEVDHSRRYSGPCPPAGQSHRYRFIVYALRDATVSEQALATGTAPNSIIHSSTIETALTTRITAVGRLAGIYPAAFPVSREGSVSGGGYRCTSQWNCPTVWNYCNAQLQQSRICTDINRCDQKKLTKIENRSCTACEESWVCTPWNACQNGQQTRDCIDEHSCITTTQKPGLQKSCQQIVEPGPAPVRVQPQLPPPPIQQPALIPIPSFWDKYKWFVTGIPAALLVIVLIIFGVVHLFKPKPVVYNMEELKEWVQKEKEMGTSAADIETLLTEHTGWSKEDIEGKFAELKETLPKSPVR